MGFVLLSLDILVNALVIHPLSRFLALLCVVISFVSLVLRCSKLLFLFQCSWHCHLRVHVVALVATACSFQLEDFRNCSFVIV